MALLSNYLSIPHDIKKVALIFPDAYLFSHEYFRPYITEFGNDKWGETQFFINPKEGEFDGIVVIQSTRSLEHAYRLICSPTRTLLVLKEPPNILFLPEEYTRQFYCSLSQDKRIRSRVRIFSHSGHHWFVEINIHKTKEIAKYPKTKLISAIVSNKSDTPGHRKRFEFIKKLKRHFGDRLDWFGRGIKELDSNKIDGLRDYKYHVVLENGSWAHYWTEKLADAFVANCFPFYWGAPNIFDYFEPGELRLIDVEDVEGSIRTIEEALTSDLYECSQKKLVSARTKIFNKYHPYQTYIDILQQLPQSPPCEVLIKPHHEFKYDLNSRLQLKLQKYSSRIFAPIA